MFDFIPKISKYRNCLAQLLKKNPPKWNSVHTKAIQQLKELAKKASSATDSRTKKMNFVDKCK